MTTHTHKSGLTPAKIASNDDFKDALNSVLREGARDLLARAVNAELALFLEAYADKRDEKGYKSIVRNGYLPKRQLQTGLGAIEIEVPRTRDRSGEGVVFSSKLLPPYLKRTLSLDALLPYLYLKGLSSNDFEPSLKALLGDNAKGLSPSTILRLREGWRDDYTAFGKRQIDKKFVYIWADGVYLEARERTFLVKSLAWFEISGACRAVTCHRRWCFGVLKSSIERLSDNQTSALLAAQIA